MPPALQTVVAIASLLASGPPRDGWKMVRSTHGIEVSNHPADGGTGEWIRGVVTDSIPLEVVGAVLLDVSSYPRWMELLEESRIVERYSTDDYVLYNRYSAPWPLRPRDVYVRVTIRRDLAVGKVTASISKHESPRFPPREGVVRVPVMEGYLTLQALSRNRTRGEFTERVDVGGALPGWAKSYLNSRMPERVLKYVRSACRDSHYVRQADTSQVARSLDEAVREGRIPP